MVICVLVYVIVLCNYYIGHGWNNCGIVGE